MLMPRLHALASSHRFRWAMATGMLACCFTLPATGQAADTEPVGNSNRTDASWPGVNAADDSATASNFQSGNRVQRTSGIHSESLRQRPETRPQLQPAPYLPGEFERYVQQQASRQADTLSSKRSSAADTLQELPNAPIRRLGANLVTDSPTGDTLGEDPLPAVPGDYIVKPGDEILLTIWGGFSVDLRTVVDRSGRIAVPRVGAIQVAGLRNAELVEAISQRVGEVFRNFQLSASLGQLRPVRVFVTGYAQRPGSLTVSSLASVLHVVMRAGGPSSAGSFRDIRLIRAGKTLANFDLYGLLLEGDRRADQIIQPDDVIHFGPVGMQVGVIGSVNQPAVFELRPGETLDDVLRMAGGLTASADRSRVAVERLADRASGRVAELALPAAGRTPLGSGDLVRAFSALSAALPQDKQQIRVRVEGEVLRPGDFILPPQSSIADALRAAGGMTRAAYVFGTNFTRETVRRTQQENYDRALRDLETEMAKSQAGRRSNSAEEAANLSNNTQANSRLIERLRQIKPTGRVVLQLPPDSQELPAMMLEDGDSLYIPPRPTSVGVFGSVFNSGSFVFEPSRSPVDYLRLAGGPTRGADRDSMFVIRANGSVVSTQQDRSFLGGSNAFTAASTLPGDTLFVPEELDKTTLTQHAKDWTQILYQFGLGLAGIKALGL